MTIVTAPVACTQSTSQLLDETIEDLHMLIAYAQRMKSADQAGVRPGASAVNFSNRLTKLLAKEDQIQQIDWAE